MQDQAVTRTARQTRQRDLLMSPAEIMRSRPKVNVESVKSRITRDWHLWPRKQLQRATFERLRPADVDDDLAPSLAGATDSFTKASVIHTTAVLN